MVFEDARQWYAYSGGGGLVSPKTIMEIYEPMVSQPTETPIEEAEQTWAALKGIDPE